MRPSLDIAPAEKLLDTKYYLWFGLMLLKSLQSLAAPGLSFFDDLLVGVFLVMVALNINRPVELLFLFIMAYYSDLRDWLSRYALVDSGGTRILFLDLFFMLLIFLTAYKIFYDRFISHFFLAGLFGFLTLFWVTNFLRGLADSSLGYVIGEGRFYLASVFVVAGATLFRYRPVYAVRKFARIVSLCSLNIAFYLLLMILVGEREEGRFNPGNSEVEVMMFALLICFLDFLYQKDLHILKVNKGVLIAVYIGLIFLTGVRAIILITGVLTVFFLFLSPRLSMMRKVLIAGGILVAGVLFTQLEATQKVLATQAHYIDVLQGKGSKHSRTTADFRKLMWGVFWEKLTESPQRMLTGRPFSNEQIDISRIGWAHREGSSTVDNSLAHNDFLAIAMTNGLPFSLLLLTFFGLYSLRAFQAARGSPEGRPYFILMGWVLFSQILQSGTNAEIKHYGFSITLWFLVGLLAALFNHSFSTDHAYETSQD